MVSNIDCIFLIYIIFTFAVDIAIVIESHEKYYSCYFIDN